MNWRRVRWLFLREARDQLRDRRTMFTILVLPLLLYPLMGLLMLQVAQLRTPRQLDVTVVNADTLPESLESAITKTSSSTPPADNDSDNKNPSPARILCSRDPQGNVITWRLTKRIDRSVTIESPEGQRSVEPLTAEVPPALSNRQLLDSFGSDTLLLVSEHEGTPKFEVIADLAADDSQIAYNHVLTVIEQWRQSNIRETLLRQNVDLALLEPPPVATVDVAEDRTRQVMLWAKVLPLVMFVWALTGAFYPAIDLCAGEKERGTLETLLSGPATRREIVYGKLFAVICFSVLTAILNLLSMQITIAVVSQQFAHISTDFAATMGPLPLGSIGWLLVMLLPISILFSAVALAIAALARSSKEGQYYLMPLLVVGMPLVMLPMMPGIKLSIGTSMFPVAGAILLARSLVEGQYAVALMYLPLVVLVTGISCWLATRWAVRQFETETVLFRETDRFDVASWLHHLWRDRAAVASPSMAIVCGAIILIALFYVRLQTAGGELTWHRVAQSTIATQLAMILAPCLIMATFLTTSIRKALRLHRVGLVDLGVAVILAISIHPSYVFLAESIQAEFPFSEETKQALSGIDNMLAGAPLTSLLLVFAVIPAICEELAFRGFIFAGLAHNRGVVRAIFLTALLFGLSHGVLQQSISAGIMGLVLGLVAWRTGSVLLCILIHICHNSLSMLMVRAATLSDETHSLLQPFVRHGAEGLEYTGNWQAVSAVVMIAAIFYFVRNLELDGKRSSNTAEASIPKVPSLSSKPVV